MTTALADSGPDGHFDDLQTVRQDGKHGVAFGYRTIDTDALAWSVSRVAEQEITGLFAARI